MKKAISLISITLPASLSLAENAMASEGGAANFIFNLVNFIIFLFLLPFVLKVLFGVNLFTIFKDRGQKLSTDVHEAQGQKQEAQTTYESLNEKLDKIGDRIRQMSQEASTMGSKLRDEIVHTAKKRAEMAIEEGKMMAERETKLAREHLKKGLLELSAQMTEKKIKEKLDEKKHSDLIEGCIKQLEGM